MINRLLLPLLFLSLLVTSCSKDSNTHSENEKIKEGTFNYKTFDNVKTAFGKDLNQGVEQSFTFPTDIDLVNNITMYVQNPCPNKTCDEWDTYANVYVKNKKDNQWYEMARFVTPYWVGTEKIERGFQFDVTDFKSLLTGEVELRIFTETWNDKGRVYSVDFDFTYGKSAYKYSAVIPIQQYNKTSIDGVPYGRTHNFNLKHQFTLPKNTEQAYIRTLITGWGHATPADAQEGRPCAEWCYRTHEMILNETTFKHILEPLGCANNIINNQNPGNWKPDRAGWCPGMEVPIRLNMIPKEMFGKTISFEYKFEPWQNNMKGGEAYYAISNFVIVQSNTPIKTL